MSFWKSRMQTQNFFDNSARQSPSPPPALPPLASTTPRDIEKLNGAASNYTQMDPPRLSGPKRSTRFMLVAVCFIVFGLICLMVTAALNCFSLHHNQHNQLATAPNMNSGSSKDLGSRRPLPALLKRFSKLQKATAPDRGATHESLEELFPAWTNRNDPAIREISLALAFFAQRLQPHTESAEIKILPEGSFNKDIDL